MLFSKKHPNPIDDTINLSLANQTINKVTSTKYLGMMIDDKLNSEVHLNYTKKKSSGLDEIKIIYGSYTFLSFIIISIMDQSYGAPHNRNMFID